MIVMGCKTWSAENVHRKEEIDSSEALGMLEPRANTSLTTIYPSFFVRRVYEAKIRQPRVIMCIDTVAIGRVTQVERRKGICTMNEFRDLERLP